MKALDGTPCGLQILLSLACGLRWGRSLAATRLWLGKPPQEEASLWETPQPLQTPVLDLGQPSWPQAAVGLCPLLW